MRVLRIYAAAAEEAAEAAAWYENRHVDWVLNSSVRWMPRLICLNRTSSL